MYNLNQYLGLFLLALLATSSFWLQAHKFPQVHSKPSSSVLLASHLSTTYFQPFQISSLPLNQTRKNSPNIWDAWHYRRSFPGRLLCHTLHHKRAKVVKGEKDIKTKLVLSIPCWRLPILLQIVQTPFNIRRPLCSILHGYPKIFPFINGNVIWLKNLLINLRVLCDDTSWATASRMKQGSEKNPEQ